MADSGMGTGDDSAVIAGRLSSQLLSGPPARSAEGVVDRLLAVQAQDRRGARLSVRSRSSGLLAADVDRALTDSRSLVITWLNRGTLHLVAAADYWWLQQLTTPQLKAGNERRLRQEGVSPAQAERGVAVVADSVMSHGPQTRQELRRRLDASGVPTAGQALVHVLFAASLRGHVVRGPLVGHDQAFVSVPAWLGPPPPPLDRAEALARLARRYLAGHGPAGAEDLAKWAGVTLGDARRGMAAIAGVTLGDARRGMAAIAGVTLGDARRGMAAIAGVTVGEARRGMAAIAGELVPAADPPGLAAQPVPVASPPAPRLLGPFDPLLHGWASRRPFVGRHGAVVTSGGIFRPVALVDGRVVATWSLSAGRVALRPLEPIAPGALDALAADAADVLRFLGLPQSAMVIA